MDRQNNAFSGIEGSISESTEEKIPVDIEEEVEKEVKDSTLTHEQIATAVSLDMKGEKLMSPTERNKMNQLLCESIRKMVFGLATKYSITCIDDTEDLAQDCMFRILSQLWRYDSSKAKFTTWSWWVCCSVLNKKYRTGQKQKSFVADSRSYTDEEGRSVLENLPEKPLEGVQRNECKGILANEIVDTVRSLVAQYPKNKALLLEMFGDPDSSDFVMPSYISVSASAKAVGMEYNRARMFYIGVVRPFFVEKFEG